MPSGTSSSAAIAFSRLRSAALVILREMPPPRAGVGHQHRIAAGEREIGGQRRALVAALLLDDLHQQHLPALDHFLDLVLARARLAALRHLLQRVLGADALDRSSASSTSLIAVRRRVGLGFAPCARPLRSPSAATVVGGRRLARPEPSAAAARRRSGGFGALRRPRPPARSARGVRVGRRLAGVGLGPSAAAASAAALPRRSSRLRLPRRPAPRLPRAPAPASSACRSA